MAGFYGWREESRGGDREDAHRWGYPERSMADALTQAGFESVARRLSGPDTEPWHLNMLATKPAAGPPYQTLSLAEGGADPCTEFTTRTVMPS